MAISRNNKFGSVMNLASPNPITIPPTSTIMTSMKTMVKYSFRRVPIADAGTKRIEGIVTAMDILNFLGGGEKHRLVKERYAGNYLAAVNEEVREIMEKNVFTISVQSSWEDALNIMLENNVGGLPVVDEEDRVVGIITERDLMKHLSIEKKCDASVSDYMTKGVITADPKMSIEDAMKLMVQKKIRRLPAVRDGVLIGLLTATSIIHYFSGEAFRKIVTGNVKDIISQPISTILTNEKVMKYREPLVVKPYEKISQVVKTMLETNQSSALVVDGELIGIITERDLMRALCDT